MLTERQLAERVGAIPGMGRIAAALADAPPCYLVGGAVRDLLLGRLPADVDIAVEGDAEEAARLLAAELGGTVEPHRRFGTATIAPSAATGLPHEINLAGTRRETYQVPGALPEVEPAPLSEDLRRRDFTVNAMAVDLVARQPALHDPLGGCDDLAAGLIRVLHPRSFEDDPTRLLRAVRYAVRLGFALEPGTERLARAAVAAGAPATVSGGRVADELLDLLAEAEAPAGVALMRELGLDVALCPALAADADLVAGAQLAAGETGADPVLAALAALLCRRAEVGGAAGWVDRLEIGAAARDAVLRAAASAPELAARLRGPLAPSALRRLLDGEPAEALALALALGAPGEPVLDYLGRLRHVRLEIDGADLVAAGVEPSPALGRALDAVLERKLDGELGGRDAELAAALAAARGA
ncbi:MAG: CCA tRNA nucleotidyltransferase [Solirubrobacterales bacterium]|nr:CCA tRNA nucleotidyltransferase [Solirubrobacterales bacterium]